MANDITAVTTMAQKSVAALNEKYPIFSLFATNYGSNTTGAGQSVNVPVFGANTAVQKAAKGASIDYASDASGSLSTVTVQMNQLVFAAHAFSLFDIENTSDETKAQVIIEEAAALGVKADKIISELAFKTENHENHDCAGKDKFTLADLIAARGLAASKKMDMDRLVVVLSPAAYNDLLADDAVAKSLTTVAQDAVAGGKIIELVGIKVTTSNATPDAYFGYLAQKTSFALAARPTTPPPTAVWSQTMSIDDGFSFTAKDIDDAPHSQRLYVSEMAFGAEVVKVKNEKRIIALKKAAGE